VIYSLTMHNVRHFQILVFQEVALLKNASFVEFLRCNVKRQKHKTGHILLLNKCFWHLASAGKLISFLSSHIRDMDILVSII